MTAGAPCRHHDVDRTDVVSQPADASAEARAASHRRAHRTPAPGRGRRSITPDQLLAGIGLGAAVVAYWPIMVSLAAQQPLQCMPLIAHVCGMLAGFGVVVMVGLMSRAPALELGVGADVLARWHARGGRIILGLILAHAWSAVAAWAQARQENAFLALGHVLHLPGLMTATVGTVVLTAVGLASARATRRRVSYETWHAVHLLTYIGIALSFTHQIAGPDLAGHRILQIGWALLYTQVFALVLRHRVFTPLYQGYRHRLRVTAVVREGPGVVSIVVEGRHLAELEAEPGQFFRWRFLTRDTWRSAHPFSLSAGPTPHRLRLTVKALGDGSTRLQNVPNGARVLAEGPYGAMTAARRTGRDVLLIAGGVGITPMRTLFETLPVTAGQNLVLLYRARNERDILFRGELDDIARRHGLRIDYLTGDDRTCLTAGSLLRRVPGLVDHDVYLCGPPAMAEAVRQALLEAGLPAAHLHEERFQF